MHNVGVIGLGWIAEGYGSPEDPNSYCHVGGIMPSDHVRLAAVADLEAGKREGFQTKWGAHFPGLKYYEGAQALLDSGECDIIAVCVRGPHHFSVMQDVIAAGPKAIFLEKPPTCSLAEMDTLVAAARAKAIPITVSYSRHWAPHVLRLQELVQSGLIGEVQMVVGYTGHSFLSFASHTTDLICQFAGYCPKAVYARGTIGDEEVPAGFEVEPSVTTMTIEFENEVTGVQIGAHGEHGGFYCDVIGTEGLVRAGIYIPPFVWKKEGGVVDCATLDMPTNASVFTMAYKQIADYLDGGPLPDCTDDDFIAVHEVGFAGIESVHRGERITLPNVHRERKIFANG